MKPPHVNTADCFGNELVGIAKKRGFVVFEGAKHTKINKKTGEFVAMIPRNNRLNKYTARGIVESMNAHGAGIAFS